MGMTDGRSGTAARRAGRTARLVATVLATCGCAVLPVWRADASCKTPLPDPSLRALDILAEGDSELAVKEARQRLAELPPSDWAGVAQVQAIIADAGDTLDDDDVALEAVAAGRAALASLADGSGRMDGVALRLQLVEADTAHGTTELEASLAALTEAESRVASSSLGHACLLLVRGRVEGRLGRPDTAARDGIASYRMAKRLNEPDAAAEAAYQLSVTYRRAGIYDSSLQFADEVVEYTRSRGQLGLLATALFARGQVLTAVGRYQEALTALADSAALSRRMHNDIGVAFTELDSCTALVGLGRVAEADRVCREAEPRFIAGHRSDQVVPIRLNQARIELLRNNPAAALARIDDVLRVGPEHVSRLYIGSLYRERANALERLGRPTEALHDLREYDRREGEQAALQKTLAVAVLQARQAAEQSDAQRLELESQIRAERARTASRATQLRLTLWLAVAASGLVVLLGFLLWLRARHQRVLRRNAEALEIHSRAIHSVREGVLLVTEDDRIEYANPAAAAILGITGEDLVGKALGQVGIDPALFASDPPVQGGGLPSGGVELRRVAPDGRSLVLQLTTSVVPLIGRKLRVCVFQDVTDLRRLERALLDGQSIAGVRLGSEVHEGIAQDLAGISMLLQTNSSGRDADSGAMLAAAGLLRETIAKLRALARGLSPVPVAGGTLAAALRQLAAETEAAAGIEVACRGDATDVPLSPIESDQLYRIAQEVVARLAHQPGLRRIAIDLRIDGEVVALSIDSVGAAVPLAFQPDDDRLHQLIAYRLRLLGGTASFAAIGPDHQRVMVSLPRGPGIEALLPAPPLTA
jgi:PAS domain S-box-containing protein